MCPYQIFLFVFLKKQASSDKISKCVCFSQYEKKIILNVDFVPPFCENNDSVRKWWWLIPNSHAVPWIAT